MGLPHYKNPQMSPIQVLNAILNGDFNAPMLMNPFFGSGITSCTQEITDWCLNEYIERMQYVDFNK